MVLLYLRGFFANIYIMEKLKIGISIGDLNGIGPEVVLKSLKDESLFKYIIPVIYASTKVISYHRNILKGDIPSYQSVSGVDRLKSDVINVINCWRENVNIQLGTGTEESGKYAWMALDQAANDLVEGKIDALVTAPISKEALKMAGFPFDGHTEFLADKCKGNQSLMLMVSDQMKMALATTHTAIRNVPDMITKELIEDKIHQLEDSLKKDFGIEKPVIAVFGLNPHAGEKGILGTEEEEVIRPSIISLKKNGMIVMGPYPSDGFFRAAQYKKFDGILAMYHDQGLIPFKALSFNNGVNYTANLPVVRTSPDHGTGFEIAGKNQANPDSFRHAIYTAIDIVRNRKIFDELSKEVVEKKPKPSEDMVN